MVQEDSTPHGDPSVPPPPPPPPPVNPSPVSWREKQNSKLHSPQPTEESGSTASSKRKTVEVDGTQVPAALASAFTNPGLSKDKKPFSYLPLGSEITGTPSKVKHSQPAEKVRQIASPKCLPIVTDDELEQSDQFIDRISKSKSPNGLPAFSPTSDIRLSPLDRVLERSPQPNPGFSRTEIELRPDPAEVGSVLSQSYKTANFGSLSGSTTFYDAQSDLASQLNGTAEMGVVHKQYNDPIHLYSKDAVSEAFHQQTDGTMQSSKPEFDITKSGAYLALQEEEKGRQGNAPAAAGSDAEHQNIHGSYEHKKVVSPTFHRLQLYTDTKDYENMKHPEEDGEVHTARDWERHGKNVDEKHHVDHHESHHGGHHETAHHEKHVYESHSGGQELPVPLVARHDPLTEETIVDHELQAKLAALENKEHVRTVQRQPSWTREAQQKHEKWQHQQHTEASYQHQHHGSETTKSYHGRPTGGPSAQWPAQEESLKIEAVRGTVSHGGMNVVAEHRGAQGDVHQSREWEEHGKGFDAKHHVDHHEVDRGGVHKVEHHEEHTYHSGGPGGNPGFHGAAGGNPGLYSPPGAFGDNPVPIDETPQVGDPNFRAKIAEAERTRVMPERLPSWTEEARAKHEKWQHRVQEEGYEHHAPPPAAPIPAPAPFQGSTGHSTLTESHRHTEQHSGSHHFGTGGADHFGSHGGHGHHDSRGHHGGHGRHGAHGTRPFREPAFTAHYPDSRYTMKAYVAPVPSTHDSTTQHHTDRDMGVMHGYLTGGKKEFGGIYYEGSKSRYLYDNEYLIPDQYFGVPHMAPDRRHHAERVTPKKEINISTLVSGEAEVPVSVRTDPFWKSTAETKTTTWKHDSSVNPDLQPRQAPAAPKVPSEPPPPWTQKAEVKHQTWQSQGTYMDPERQPRQPSTGPPPAWTSQAQRTQSLWAHEADAWRQRQVMEEEMTRRSREGPPPPAPGTTRTEVVTHSKPETSADGSHTWRTSEKGHHAHSQDGSQSVRVVTTTSANKPGNEVVRWKDAKGAHTKAMTSGAYLDPEGHKVNYTKEVYTSSDPGKEFSMLTEEEKKVLDEPLQPGVISRHATTKYYKKSTYTTTTTSQQAAAGQQHRSLHIDTSSQRAIKAGPVSPGVSDF